jgi:hypothetical protein
MKENTDQLVPAINITVVADARDHASYTFFTRMLKSGSGTYVMRYGFCVRCIDTLIEGQAYAILTYFFFKEKTLDMVSLHILVCDAG